MYSTSQDESETTGSFFEYQEIGVPSNIKMYPSVDFRSSLSPHQFESIKPDKLYFMLVCATGKRILQPTESLTYLRILLTAAKWDTFGLPMNLLTILTINVKYSRVLHK